MGCRIRLVIGDLSLEGELNDSETARRISEALPIASKVNTWGQEIYFTIPVRAEQSEDARMEMQRGELAYWCVGQALCLFWGRTPASQDDEPRAYSPVNPVGRVQCDDWSALDGIADGTEVRVEKVE